MSIRIPLFCLAALLVVAVEGRSAAYSSLSLFLQTGEYFGDTYTAPPTEGAGYVFFQGEPIKLKVTVANQGSDLRSLLTRPGGPAANVQFVTMRASEPVAMSFAVGDRIHERGGSANGEIMWADAIPIAPRNRIEFDVNPEYAFQAPGRYLIELRSQLVDASGQALNPQATRFTFELRDLSLNSSKLESARRAAVRSFLTGHFAEALSHTAEMLSLNATSFAAHSLRGDIALQQTDPHTAETEYLLAIRLLQENGDAEYARWSSAVDKKDALDALTVKLERARQP